jgi:exopolysaccharide biosynthesis polyprenyl glycosylphosphotransferase
VRPRWPIRLIVYAGDALCILGALVFARTLWIHSTETPLPVAFPTYGLFGINPHMPPALLLGLFWYAALAAEGLYDPVRMISSVRIAQGLFRAALTVVVGAVLVQYFTSDKGYSRTLLMAFLGASALGLAAWRLLFFRVQAWVPDVLPRTGVLVVGVGDDARLLAERLTRYGSHVYELRGYLRAIHEEPVAVAGPILGSIAEIRQVIADTDAHLVLLASRVLSRDEALGLTSACAHMGLDVLQVPFTWGLATARVESVAVGELELVRVGGLSYPSVAETVKRAFDLVAVFAGGTLLLPFLVAVALAIKLQDGGPILYVGQRAGRGGRRFPFYKFRSMVVNADQLKAGLRDANESDGRLFKLSNDPRITAFGAFIRKYSIDELPQLLNVILGDMNLVGPRPLPIDDLKGIDADPEHRYWFDQRSRVNPGITGMWQVEGRSDLSFSRMVELDVYYIQNWSLFLDLQILLRTIPAVLRGRGAR